jgi:hypothetical protein
MIEKNHANFIAEVSTIADITVDQFGGPRVYVGQLQEPWETGR